MIELFSIDFVMAATDQLLALTRVARTSGTDLRSLRTVEIAGNVPTRALLEAAIIYVCKNIFCRYGASETGLMARAYARNVLSRPGFAGHIMPGIEIAIVDRNGNLCPSGKVGLVRCRRHSRWDEPLSNGNRVERSWIDLGDVGWMTAEGELYILGRDADMTAVHLPGVEGQQVSPVHEVEHLLRLEWDATDAAAVIAGDDSDGAAPQIWIGILDCKGVTKEDFEAILRSKGIDFEVRLFPMQSIPRAVNGKVNRSQLKSLMLASAG